jgi:ActR/RegA family two-component response regulator
MRGNSGKMGGLTKHFSGRMTFMEERRKTQQCLILTKDPFYSDLLDMTLKQQGFRPRITSLWDRMGALSSMLPTVAWFIDLDAVTFGVREVVAKAHQIAPDARLIFFSSRFTEEMAIDCIRHQALSLLVKPFQMERLMQTVVLLRQEPELAENGGLIPSASPVATREEPSDPGSALKRVQYDCPVCGTGFQGLRFKIWVFPVTDTDSDFCPVTHESVHPELYSVMVCPTCLYGNYVGQFSEARFQEHLRKGFLQPKLLEERQKASFNLNLQGKRTLMHGIRSFELAALSALDLQAANREKLAGEFYLKESWLCRRMGHSKQEQEAQEKALQCFKKVYQPFVGHAKRDARIVQKLGNLSDRAIVVTGYLAGEVSRRLGLYAQAKFYLDDILQSPFLVRYSSLLSQAHATARRVKDEMAK